MMATGSLFASNGAAPSNVQRLLTDLGYYSGPINGEYNYELVVAIRNYQEAMGITPDARHDDGRIGWGMWDSTTENATNYLVHYITNGTRYWSGNFGRVDWDPSASSTPPPGLGDTTTSPPITETDQTRVIDPGDLNVPDAAEYLARTIEQNFGIPGLRSWIEDRMKQGYTDEQIMTDFEQTDQFKERFPAMEIRKQKGLPRIAPENYLRLERDYAQVLRSAGISNFFDDKELTTEIIANDVSVQELETRVMDGYRRVLNAAPEVREMFGAYFGIDGDSALAAYFLDPAKTTDRLLQQVEQAAVAGVASTYGFSVGQETTLDLVQRGVNQQRAQEGFATIQELEPVFAETLGETQDLTAEEEGVAAAFRTGQPGVRLIEGRVRSRTNLLSGQAGAAMDQTGIIGFGTNV